MSREIFPIVWDSAFFKRKIGRIEVDTMDDISMRELNAFDLVYVFSKDDKLDFKLVDKKVTYLIDDLRKTYLPPILNLELYDTNKDNYDDLLELALQSGEYSRFKLDSNFLNNEYEKLYKEWIDKSISKELASDIVIRKVNGKIVGFSTLSRKDDSRADIGLVAVDLNFRGQGIAKDIILKSMYIAKEQGFNEIQVVTQLDNKPANILYSKLGFKKESLIYIYHVWNNDTI